MTVKTYETGAVRIRMACAEEIADSDFFPLFRCGDLEPDCAVDVIRWALPPETGAVIYRDTHRCRRLAGGRIYDYTFWSDTLQRKPTPYACAVRSDGRIKLFIDYGAQFWDRMVFDAVGIPDLLLERGTAVLHASFIAVGDAGVLFAGQKQAGKSTQAALWRTHRNAVVVNGDRAALRFTDGGAMAYGVPFCGSSRVCLNQSLPVAAIVFPEKADENGVAPLSGADAFKRLLGCLSYTKTDAAVQARAIAFAERLAMDCRCLSLSCRKDAGAVETLADALGL